MPCAIVGSSWAMALIYVKRLARLNREAIARSSAHDRAASLRLRRTVPAVEGGAATVRPAVNWRRMNWAVSRAACCTTTADAPGTGIWAGIKAAAHIVLGIWDGTPSARGAVALMLLARSLTTGGAGGTNPTAGPSTNRRTMWRMRVPASLIFVASGHLMVALLLAINGL
jgi:hypothetical protein